jgi:hypothetical protein
MVMETTAIRPDTRRAYLDRLKVELITLIIIGHAVLGYSGYAGSWPYQPIREVHLAPVTDLLLGPVLLPMALFAMGLFFLISGLLTPASLARKGTRVFVRDRLVRLGIPFVVWVLLLWPALIFAMHRLAGDRPSYWSLFIGARLDTGPMWFVEVLLIYSLGYALWRWLRPAPAARRAAELSPVVGPGPVVGPEPGPLTRRTLVLLGVTVAVGTYLVRLVFPFQGTEFAHLNLWQWPQYLVLFGLGIAAARRGWLDPVPDRLRRGCGIAALAGLAATLVLIRIAAELDLDAELFAGGPGRAAASVAVLEGVFAVAIPVWLLGNAQRYADRPLSPLATVLARSAYGAFILQGPVLVGLALTLRPVALPAEAKALAVAVLGVVLSYPLAWLLVSRTPLRRIL